MTSDTLTFTLAFLAVFGGLAVYLWRLENTARRLEARLTALEAEREDGRPDHARGDDTKEKSLDGDGADQA